MGEDGVLIKSIRKEVRLLVVGDFDFEFNFYLLLGSPARGGGQILGI